MTLHLSELGEDIIASNICNYLSADDIFALLLTNKYFNKILTTNDVYHSIYLKKFGSTKPTPLNLNEYNWSSLFKMRSSPKVNLYTWGSSKMGRLGYLIRDINQDHISIGGLTKNVHTATNVPNFNDFIISDISAGGFSFQILMNDGSLYHTGASWTDNGQLSKSTPGPMNKKDYKPPLNTSNLEIPFIANMSSRRLIRGPHILPAAPEARPSATPTRGVSPMPLQDQRYDRDVSPQPEQTRGPTSVNLTKPPEDLTFPSELQQPKIKETSFITRVHLPGKYQAGKIRALSSGRQHFIALDEDSNIFSWDTGTIDKTGCKIEFVNLPKDYIKKVSAGWNLSACYMSKVGIVVWYSREAVTKEEYENGLMKSIANHLVIPGTSGVIDFVALNDCILFINSHGKLFRFDLATQDYANGDVDRMTVNLPVEMETFNSWLHQNDDNAKFSKVTGCFNRFAIFTDGANILLGDKNDDDAEPTLIEELQKKNIIHIVMGDYHYMALTDTGNLLSWGTESAKCGCLGLGSKKEYCTREHLPYNDEQISTSRPALVKLPGDGKWLAVAAAGWHSSGLYIDHQDE